MPIPSNRLACDESGVAGSAPFWPDSAGWFSTARFGDVLSGSISILLCLFQLQFLVEFFINFPVVINRRLFAEKRINDRHDNERAGRGYNQAANDCAAEGSILFASFSHSQRHR